MNTYKVIFNEGQTDGVYAISLVEAPAMESNFVALSKQPEEIRLKAIDQEKRILLGAVLIPDKLILRKMNGEEFNIVFPAETIRLSMENFAKQGYHNNSTFNHTDTKLSNVTFVESWIKEDMVKDKAALFGFDEPVGTWYAAMKVNDDEVWNDFVKTGKVKGFSIDGFFDFEKVTLNKYEMNTKEEKSFIDRIVEGVKEAFSGKSPKVVELGSAQANDGEIVFNFEGDDLKPDLQVTMTGADGEQVPVPDGTYTITSQEGETEVKKNVTVVNSIITEIKETEEEAPVVASSAPSSQPTEAPAIKSEEVIQKVVYAMATETGKQIKEMESRLEAKLSQMMEDAAKPVQLTKAKGEEQRTWEEMTPFEKYKASKS